LYVVIFGTKNFEVLTYHFAFLSGIPSVALSHTTTSLFFVERSQNYTLHGQNSNINSNRENSTECNSRKKHK